MPGPLRNEAIGRPARRSLKPSLAREVVALPSAAPPSAPAHLGAPGREAWENAFRSAGWLVTASDAQLVEQWAEMHDERADLVVLIAAQGRTTVGSQGQLVSHPAVLQLRACEASMSRLASVLGLGPQNRARLGQKLTSAPGERVLSDAERRLALAHRGRKS